jgi:hypothetical protein
MNDPSQAKLEWRAFQYVTQALSEAEREEFEREMLESQDGREAVARAVELALAAEFACRTSVEMAAARTRISPSRNSRRWVWSAVAASLMFFIGWQASVWFLGGDLNRSGGPDVAESETESTDVMSMAGRDLALAWVQTRRTFTLAELDREFAALTGAEADGSVESNDAPVAMADVEAPSWMLAAVAGMQGVVATEGASPEDSPADPVSPSDPRDEG